MCFAESVPLYDELRITIDRRLFESHSPLCSQQKQALRFRVPVRETVSPSDVVLWKPLLIVYVMDTRHTRRSNWSAATLAALQRTEFEATRTPGRCLFDVLETLLGLDSGCLNEQVAHFLLTSGDTREWCRRYGAFKAFPGARGARREVVTPEVWAKHLRDRRDRWLDAVLDVKLVAAACDRPIYVLLRNPSLAGAGVVDVEAAEESAPASAPVAELLKCSPALLVRRSPDGDPDARLGEKASVADVGASDLVITYGGAHFRGTRRLDAERAAKRRRFA